MIATSAATGPRLMVCVSILAAAPSIGVAFTAPSKVIGTPARDQQEREDQTQGHEDEDQGSHQINVEVSQVLVAAQAADHGQHHGQPRGGRDELKPDDAAELTEITQMLLAGVVLEIRIGHKRADRVEHHAGIGTRVVDPGGILVTESAERALAVGVKREDTAGRTAGRS